MYVYIYIYCIYVVSQVGRVQTLFTTGCISKLFPAHKRGPELDGVGWQIRDEFRCDPVVDVFFCICMENGPLIVDLPTKNGDFP